MISIINVSICNMPCEKGGKDLPGGTVDGSPPANAGDMGSICRRADPIELGSFLVGYLDFITESMRSHRKVLSKIIS